MPITVAEVDNKSLWESFIKRNSPASLFQSWLWGDVQESLGTKVWRLGVYKNDDLIGIALVTKVDAKRGKFLHVRHGPIFNKNTPENWSCTLKYLISLAHKEGCWFIRVSPLLADTPENRQLFNTMRFAEAPIHAMDAELCWVLDIDKSDDELLQGMRKTTRYEIKRAIKFGVKVSKAQTTDDLHTFMQLYDRTSSRQGFVPHKGIYEEFNIFNRSEQALLLLGSIHDEILAGAIIVFYGNQAIYHHGASIPNTIPVSYLVQWEALREAKKRGYKIYNFWGIAPDDNPNHPWRGITLFKKGFGGREIKYIHAQDLPVSPLYILPRTVETVRRMSKGY